MNNEKMGQFIAELRKGKQMTQKDLAAKLNITDKAVSKWERGLSCPDISLLSSIADILGVTTGELLEGERSNSNPAEARVSVDNALHYADKAVKNKARSIQNISAAVFSALLLIGIGVCAICDLAISGGFTWSLYPISSAVLAWAVLFPVIKLGKKGISVALLALSLMIVPFLWVLDRLIVDSELLLPIGIAVAIITLVFLWTVFALSRVPGARKPVVAAISLLLLIPVNVAINYTLASRTFQPLIDVWDIGSYLIIVLASAALFAADAAARKKKAI